MKRYIQPSNHVVEVKAEGTIATSNFSINKEAANSDALSNEKDLWGNEDVWK